MKGARVVYIVRRPRGNAQEKILVIYTGMTPDADKYYMTLKCILLNLQVKNS